MGRTVYFQLELHNGDLRINQLSYYPKFNEWSGTNDLGGTMKVMEGLPKNLKGYGKIKIDSPTQSEMNTNKFSNGELQQIVANNLDRWSADLAHELIKALVKITK